MCFGERCLLQVDKSEQQGPIEVELEIIRFGNLRKNDWELSSENRENKAKDLKNQGNQQMQSQQYEQAAKLYEQAVKIINSDSFDDLKSLIMGNLSQAYIKLNKFDLAADFATQAIQIQPTNIKFYYRRAIAYIQTSQFDRAQIDINKGLELDKSSKDFLALQDELKQKQAAMS